MRKEVRLIHAVTLCSCLGALVAGGCNGSVIEPPNEQVPREWFICIAEGLPASAVADVQRELQMLVGQVARMHDMVHVLSGPHHTPIATFEVPAGAPRTRLRKSAVANGFRQIGDSLRVASDRDSAKGSQLNIPELAATVRSLRRTDFDACIILVGNPLYNDLRQRGWSMLEGYVPTDSSLRSPQSPFFNGVEDFPANTRVSWLAPASDWGTDPVHRQAVTRFFRLFFQEHQANLTRLTADAAAAFELSSTQFIEPVAFRDKLPSAMQLVARESRRAPIIATPDDVTVDVNVAPESQTMLAPQYVEQIMGEAQESMDSVVFAINWESADPRCDVDLWIGDKSSIEELNFKNMQTSFGELFRDVRTPGSIGNATGDLQNWECAQVHHTRLQDLTLWINVFETTAPVTIRLIGICKGQRREKTLRMEVSQGDRAEGQLDRMGNDAWRQVRL